MTKSSKRREFSDAFKLQVLSEYFSGGGSKLSVARKYGLSHGLLLAWMKKWPVDSKCLSLPEEIINTRPLQNLTPFSIILVFEHYWLTCSLYF